MIIKNKKIEEKKNRNRIKISMLSLHATVNEIYVFLECFYIKTFLIFKRWRR